MEFVPTKPIRDDPWLVQLVSRNSAEHMGAFLTRAYIWGRNAMLRVG